MKNCGGSEAEKRRSAEVERRQFTVAARTYTAPSWLPVQGLPAAALALPPRPRQTDRAACAPVAVPAVHSVPARVAGTSCRLGVHTRFSRCDFLIPLGLHQRKQPPHLLVRDQSSSVHENVLKLGLNCRCRRRSGNFDCRWPGFNCRR